MSSSSSMGGKKKTRRRERDDNRRHPRRGGGDGDAADADDDGRRRGRGRDERESVDETRTLERQLRELNLERASVEADGNCFFRALADQKFGDEGRHGELRARVVEYIEAKREDFAPFVEDDEKFEDYVARMSRDGEWAGHLEVNAATAVLRVGVCIHQAGSPRWVAGADARDENALVYNVSYEGSDHYNSVRVREGRRDLPGGPLCVAVLRDGDMTEVTRRTGCANAERIRRTLRACRNDVDACVDTIEEEIEEEKRLREKAVDDGVDVEEFDGGDWAEVKSKKNKRPAGRHRKRGEEDGISMESLGI